MRKIFAFVVVALFFVFTSSALEARERFDWGRLLQEARFWDAQNRAYRLEQYRLRGYVYGQVRSADDRALWNRAVIYEMHRGRPLYRSFGDGQYYENLGIGSEGGGGASGYGAGYGGGPYGGGSGGFSVGGRWIPQR